MILSKSWSANSWKVGEDETTGSDWHLGILDPVGPRHVVQSNPAYAPWTYAEPGSVRECWNLERFMLVIIKANTLGY